MGEGVLGGRERNCRFLTGRYMFVCNAGESYVPSEFELDEYCRDTMHTMCPYFMKLYVRADAAMPTGSTH